MSFTSFALLAQQTITTVTTPTTQALTPAPGWLEFLRSMGPIILVVLFLFIFMGGSKRKQERERRALLDSLKKGSQVRLIGGEFGSIVDVKDGRVLVKVDESSNTKIWYAREAVASVEKEETK